MHGHIALSAFPFSLPAWFAVAGGFCLGACLGSFVNVLVWRLPRPGLSPLRPARSLCPRCGAKIPWYDNIPVLSWLLLRGLCRSCGGPISCRYTAIELLTAALVAVLGWLFLSRVFYPVTFLWWTLLAAGLIACTFIDFELMLLPDEVTLPGLAVAPWFFLLFPHGPGPGADPIGLSVADFLGDLPASIPAEVPHILAAGVGAGTGVLLGEYFRRRRSGSSSGGYLAVLPAYLLGAAVGFVAVLILTRPILLAHTSYCAFVSSLAGASSGAAAMALIRFLGRYAFAQEAMGFGDVKLGALLGGLSGVGGTLWTLVVASVAGSVFGLVLFAATGRRHVPFGPFLILGAALAVFFRSPLSALLAWYGQVLSS